MPLIRHNHPHPFPPLQPTDQLLKFRPPGRNTANAFLTEYLHEVVAILLRILPNLGFEHV
jgi:hypothetical protein